MVVINTNYELGNLKLSRKRIKIKDLIEYANKKTCGRIFSVIKFFLLGKGLITKENVSKLISKDSNRDEILKEYPILAKSFMSGLIKTHDVATAELLRKNEGKESRIEEVSEEEVKSFEKITAKPTIIDPSPNRKVDKEKNQKKDEFQPFDQHLVAQLKKTKDEKRIEVLNEGEGQGLSELIPKSRPKVI